VVLALCGQARPLRPSRTAGLRRGVGRPRLGGREVLQTPSYLGDLERLGDSVPRGERGQSSFAVSLGVPRFRPGEMQPRQRGAHPRCGKSCQSRAKESGGVPATLLRKRRRLMYLAAGLADRVPRALIQPDRLFPVRGGIVSPVQIPVDKGEELPAVGLGMHVA
jgi:hypothetical protein